MSEPPITAVFPRLRFSGSKKAGQCRAEKLTIGGLFSPSVDKKHSICVHWPRTVHWASVDPAAHWEPIPAGAGAKDEAAGEGIVWRSLAAPQLTNSSRNDATSAGAATMDDSHIRNATKVPGHKSHSPDPTNSAGASPGPSGSGKGRNTTG
jgi:hypothetical protein